MSKLAPCTAALTAVIRLLRDTLAQAAVEATTACKDLDGGNLRAAVGAIVPVGQALDDGRALSHTIFILNRNLNQGNTHAQ